MIIIDAVYMFNDVNLPCPPKVQHFHNGCGLSQILNCRSPFQSTKQTGIEFVTLCNPNTVCHMCHLHSVSESTPVTL